MYLKLNSKYLENMQHFNYDIWLFKLAVET